MQKNPKQNKLSNTKIKIFWPQKLKEFVTSRQTPPSRRTMESSQQKGMIPPPIEWRSPDCHYRQESKTAQPPWNSLAICENFKHLLTIWSPHRWHKNICPKTFSQMSTAASFLRTKVEGGGNPQCTSTDEQEVVNPNSEVPLRKKKGNDLLMYTMWMNLNTSGQKKSNYRIHL